jgi:hypothetical protein
MRQARRHYFLRFGSHLDVNGGGLQTVVIDGGCNIVVSLWCCGG